LCKELDRDNLSISIIDKVVPFLKQPEMSPEYQRKCSSAGGNIVAWMHSIFSDELKSYN